MFFLDVIVLQMFIIQVSDLQVSFLQVFLVQVSQSRYPTPDVQTQCIRPPGSPNVLPVSYFRCLSSRCLFSRYLSSRCYSSRFATPSVRLRIVCLPPVLLQLSYSGCPLGVRPPVNWPPGIRPTGFCSSGVLLQVSKCALKIKKIANISTTSKITEI